MSAPDADRYVRGIRNADKRAYAAAYLAWLRGDASGDAPEYPPTLSYMAAQAVRMRLYDASVKPRIAR